MPTVDIVTSTYNEELNISEFFQEIKSIFQKLQNYEWNLIISDNSSSDSTWEEIRKLTLTENNIKALRLSRNFGFENSILAALSESTGDYAIIMTSDLQDDPNYIPIFLDYASKGYEHVYQVVTERPKVSAIRKFNSWLFYNIANYLSNGQIMKNVSEYRLISSNVKNSLLSLKEQNRFTRGLTSWLGFKSIGVPFARRPRKKGKSKANSFHVISLAVRAILSHSYMLLDLISVFGIILSVFSFIFFIFSLFTWIIDGGQLIGLSFFASITFFLIGSIFVALGLISKYISLIYEEVKGRPHFVIQDKLESN